MKTSFYKSIAANSSPVVISGDIGQWTHHGLAANVFGVENLLTHETNEAYDKTSGNYWLGPDEDLGQFVLDFRTERSFEQIRYIIHKFLNIG